MSKPGNKKGRGAKGPEAGAGRPKQAAAGATKAAPRKEQAGLAGKTVATVFGEMVWMLSRSPKYRDLKLSDLEWLVMPPLLLRQFKLSYLGQQPVTLELFAKASPEVAARIDRGETKLLPAEWKSGEIHKLVEKIDLVADAASAFPMGGSKQSH